MSGNAGPWAGQPLAFIPDDFTFYNNHESIQLDREFCLCKKASLSVTFLSTSLTMPSMTAGCDWASLQVPAYPNTANQDLIVSLGMVHMLASQCPAMQVLGPVSRY
jgi:hypothetical protein